MKFGVQGPVIAWDDPWHGESCKTLLRTGERKWFPSQDIAPQAHEFLKFIRDKLGVDFYVHHVMPCDAEIQAFIEDIGDCGMDFIIGNEYGNVNRVATQGTNRYDIPKRLVEKAKATGHFLGLLYDETEHLQINNTIYQSDPEVFQWVNPGRKTLAETESELVDNVRSLVELYDCDVYAEVLFSTMYHAFNRGGMLISPKALQVLRQPFEFAVALGALKQYQKKWMITADIWGTDVGRWFTRLWGLPGHSVAEFESALKMSFYLAPDLLFVENCDGLAYSDSHGLHLTEFGQAYCDFIAWARGVHLPYTSREFSPSTAVIRSEDGVFSAKGTFTGAGPYGSHYLKNDEKTNSIFSVMHMLSHGTMDRTSSLMYMTGEDMPHNAWPRDEQTLKTFPRKDGTGGVETHAHKLFYPLNNVGVFDSFSSFRDIGGAEFIVVCGSRISHETAEAVMQCAAEGKTVLAADWFREQLNCPQITFVSDFESEMAKRVAAPFLGKPTEWNVRFGNYLLRITDPTNDGIRLRFDIFSE